MGYFLERALRDKMICKTIANSIFARQGIHINRKQDYKYEYAYK